MGIKPQREQASMYLLKAGSYLMGGRNNQYVVYVPVVN